MTQIMATHDCPILNCQATHQSRSRMASTVQLIHICGKGYIAGETLILCTGINNTAISFLYSRRLSWDIKHSSSDEVTAGHRDTSDNRSVVAPSVGSRTIVQQALDASSHQPWPWSGLGVTLVNLLRSLGVIRSRRDA